MIRSYYRCCCINEPVIFSHCVHLKLGHRFHALLEACFDCNDIVPLTLTPDALLLNNKNPSPLLSRELGLKGSYNIGNDKTSVPSMLTPSESRYMYTFCIHVYLTTNRPCKPQILNFFLNCNSVIL